MDSFFLLSAEARGRILQVAGRLLGCTYICTWSPLYHPAANHLISTDGWHCEEDSGRLSSSSSPRSISSRLFNTYRRSLCSIQSGCVPGLAFKGQLTYIELRDADLMNLASMDVQRQFYQAAGIKTAVFVGCGRGEIELGMTVSPNTSMHMHIQQMFSEEFIQQSQLGEDFIQPSQLGDLVLQPEQSRLSSSSSSLRSQSLGSPESSPCFLTKASAASFMPEAITEQPLLPQHQMTMQAYSRYRDAQFPAPTGEDEAVTRAMRAVISSKSSSSSPLMYNQKAVLQQNQTYQRHISHAFGAFKAYSPALAPKLEEAKLNLPGQRMIKMGIDMFRRIGRMRMEARVQEYRPTSNQLHHMISERRRREKLNENFHALRLLLPPERKKDKASVLAYTKNYLNSLKARISELEERNKLLEMQLQTTDAATEEVSDHSNERVEVQISRSSESTSEFQQINLRLTVREECDMMDLVVHALKCLKGMRDTTLVSMDVTTRSPQTNTFARANLRLQVKASDWDEESFKEAVTEAVMDVLAGRATATNPRHSSLAHQF